MIDLIDHLKEAIFWDSNTIARCGLKVSAGVGKVFLVPFLALLDVALSDETQDEYTESNDIEGAIIQATEAALFIESTKDDQTCGKVKYREYRDQEVRQTLVDLPAFGVQDKVPGVAVRVYNRDEHESYEG